LSEHVNIANGKEYRINGTKVLDATSLGSSVLITSSNITDGTIVNGDVNASAAIAGTKISPDFGSQNVTTTGTATAAALIPSGSTVPTNGVYLPSANNVAISTNGTQRLLIEADGDINIDSGGVFYDATNNRLAIGTTSPGATLDVNGKLRLSSTEDNQLEWVSGAQTWRSNVVGGGKWYLYDVTNTKFPLDVSANTTCKLDINTSHVAFTTNNSERARIDSSGLPFSWHV